MFYRSFHFFFLLNAETRFILFFTFIFLKSHFYLSFVAKWLHWKFELVHSLSMNWCFKLSYSQKDSFSCFFFFSCTLLVYFYFYFQINKLISPKSLIAVVLTILCSSHGWLFIYEPLLPDIIGASHTSYSFKSQSLYSIEPWQ